MTPHSSVCSGHARKLNYGRTHHVTLFAWTKIRSCARISYAGWWYFAGALNQEIETTVELNDHGPLLQFLNEAVFRINQQEAFIASISFLFVAKHVVDDYLSGLFDGLFSLNWICPEILHGLSPGVYDELRNSCSIACQRQFCLGVIEDSKVAFHALCVFFHWLEQVFLPLIYFNRSSLILLTIVESSGRTYSTLRDAASSR